jgi:hypothetical protein
MEERLSIHKDNYPTQNYKAIVEVVDNVDWDKVKRVMKFLDWQWHTVGVPKKKELKAQALRRAVEAVQFVIDGGKGYRTSSGGISVEAIPFDDGSIRLDVSFVLSDWSNVM